MKGNPTPQKIILTDDDADDRSFFSDAFHDVAIESDLKVFSDGTELMLYLKTTTDVLPKLLFLDLNMPRKSGFECLQEIRSDKKLKDLSVAIYSTSSSDKDIEETFANGANLYIKKPSDYLTLKKLIKNVLHSNWQRHLSTYNKDTFLITA